MDDSQCDEPREIATVGLPPPVLVPEIAPPVLLAGHFVVHEGATEARVQRPRRVVVNPAAGGQVAAAAVAPSRSVQLYRRYRRYPRLRRENSIVFAQKERDGAHNERECYEGDESYEGADMTPHS